jgi:putative N6-adenine-specific DNA methylase
MDRDNEFVGSHPYSLYVPCAAGVEAWLADELGQLLGAAVRPGRGGARVQLADAAACAAAAMRINLESRLGQRVLWCVAHAGYRDEDDLYALAREVRWGDWITPRQTLRVDVTAQRSPLRSLNFAALRIKDAICDQLRETHGERPNVDTQRPELPVLLHLGPNEATLYVDTSGEALFKRGWREDTGEAPLKETLAAAMLAAAQWQGHAADAPLLDPCCGAGTIAIEAAQLACGIAPGAQRRFAFERLGPFRDVRRDWQDLRDAATARVHAPAVPIFAGDVAFRMTDFATRNAERAGVRHAIEFKTGDALQRPPPAAAGALMLNPPYRHARSLRARHADRVFQRAREPLEAPLQRLVGLDPEPGHEAARRDAAEGKPACAALERADRVPPVPFRHGRRLGAGHAYGANVLTTLTSIGAELASTSPCALPISSIRSR